MAIGPGNCCCVRQYPQCAVSIPLTGCVFSWSSVCLTIRFSPLAVQISTYDHAAASPAVARTTTCAQAGAREPNRTAISRNDSHQRDVVRLFQPIAFRTVFTIARDAVVSQVGLLNWEKTSMRMRA